MAAILVPAAVKGRMGLNMVPESSTLRPRLQGCEPEQLARQQEGDLAVVGVDISQDAGQQGDDNL